MTAFLALMTCLLAGDLEQLDNLVVNPSFEEDRDRDGLADGWHPSAFESPAILAWDDTVAHAGM